MNSAATVIGVLTLVGLRTTPAGDWTWIGCLKQCKKGLGITLFGTAGAAMMCVSLFNVKAHGGTFDGSYPGWLQVCSGLFVVIGSVVILFPGHFSMPHRQLQRFKPAQSGSYSPSLDPVSACHPYHYAWPGDVDDR